MDNKHDANTDLEVPQFRPLPVDELTSILERTRAGARVRVSEGLNLALGRVRVFVEGDGIGPLYLGELTPADAMALRLRLLHPESTDPYWSSEDHLLSTDRELGALEKRLEQRDTPPGLSTVSATYPFKTEEAAHLFRVDLEGDGFEAYVSGRVVVAAMKPDEVAPLRERFAAAARLEAVTL